MIAILQGADPYSWADQNRMHPLGIAIMVVACAAVLLVRRRHVLLPALGVIMIVPTDQQVVIFGLDFSVLRMLIIAGWTRLLLRSELRGFRWTALDSALLAWGSAFVAANILREGAVVYSFGWLLENLGAYYLFRTLIRSWEDLYQLVLWSVIVAVPGAILFLIEKITHNNLLSIFGG